MKNFNGKILFLDRSDINTDEIIPAKYLTESQKAALKPFCLEDLILDGFDSKKDLDPYREYLSNFTAADEKKILADKEGICVLVELMDINRHTMFGTSSIVRGGSAITIIISVDEVEEELPSHTFFLLYFPEEYYNGEVIDLAF